MLDQKSNRSIKILTRVQNGSYFYWNSFLPGGFLCSYFCGYDLLLLFQPLQMNFLKSSLFSFLCKLFKLFNMIFIFFSLSLIQVVLELEHCQSP